MNVEVHDAYKLLQYSFVSTCLCISKQLSDFVKGLKMFIKHFVTTAFKSTKNINLKLQIIVV